MRWEEEMEWNNKWMIWACYKNPLCKMQLQATCFSALLLTISVYDHRQAFCLYLQRSIARGDTDKMLNYFFFSTSSSKTTHTHTHAKLGIYKDIFWEVYLDKKVIKMLRKEDLKISFQYVTMQITLGNIPDGGKKKINKQKWVLISVWTNNIFKRRNRRKQKEEQRYWNSCKKNERKETRDAL